MTAAAAAACLSEHFILQIFNPDVLEQSMMEHFLP